MQDAPRAPAPDRKWLGFLAGTVAGAAFALGLYLLAQVVQPSSGLILISVLLIPAAASALAVLVAGPQRIDTTAIIGLSALVVTALLACSAVFLREGAICLAMAAPIFYPIGIIGGLLASFLKGKSGRRRTPPAMVVMAPLLLLLVEQPSAYPTMHRTVVTQIEIDAPVDVVWREAIEIRDIANSEQRWTFTQDVLRIPRPIDARLVQRNGERVRAATWAGDVRFFEVVTDWRLGQTVAWRFEIPEAAADRLLDHHLRLDEDYLRLQGGSYAFERISPTQTRLTLRTNYMARTPFNPYAEAWGEVLLGDIHRNVLHVVRERAEARTADVSPER